MEISIQVICIIILFHINVLLQLFCMSPPFNSLDMQPRHKYIYIYIYIYIAVALALHMNKSRTTTP